MKDKQLIVIGGPTASGKTALAIELAQHFNTEVVSADSRQIYQEMSIGTAKPTIDERATVPHHFIDSHSIETPLSAGQYEKEAIPVIESLFQHHDVLILVGGSGLFTKGVCEGFDTFPAVDSEIRDTLNKEFEHEGLEKLQQELLEKDPAHYEKVDLSNHQRVIRALEVIRQTGKPFSSFQQQKSKTRSFESMKLAMLLPREELYDRINLRVDHMINSGLEEEVRNLFPKRGLKSLETVGYQELFDHLEGVLSREEAIELIKRNTRRFAKRQISWFKRDTDFQWVDPTDINTVISLIEKTRRP
jgi:tRNA dimethylallyltransferase